MLKGGEAAGALGVGPHDPVLLSARRRACAQSGRRHVPGPGPTWSSSAAKPGSVPDITPPKSGGAAAQGWWKVRVWLGGGAAGVWAAKPSETPPRRGPWLVPRRAPMIELTRPQKRAPLVAL
jgi:hypothetical protein